MNIHEHSLINMFIEHKVHELNFDSSKFHEQLMKSFMNSS